MGGPVATPLLRGDEAGARRSLCQLHDLFGSNLYVELQNHSRPKDNLLIRQLCGLAFDLHLPVVVTQDVHYATRDYARLHDAMLAIRHLETLEAARKAGHLPFNHNAYLRSADEMTRLFRERPDAIENTVKIADRCNATIDFSMMICTQELVHVKG